MTPFSILAKPEVQAPGLRHDYTTTWRVTLSGKEKEWGKFFETLGHAKDPKKPKTFLIYGYKTSK